MSGFVETEPLGWATVGNWACTDNWACMRVYASVLSDDFATMIAISELNPDVIGEDGFHAAAANCTLRSAVIEVPWFEGGDSFSTFATRMRIRCVLWRSNSIWDGLRTRLGP